MNGRPVVSTKAGAVRGRSEDGVASFLGVPYAAPPFGPRRMRPPQPVEPWDGERDATEFGPTAPKGDYPPQYRTLFPEVVIPGEDCLNLNVWTPDPGGSGLPVLVWIHGGSFTNGSSSVTAYDGAAFARSGVVCVTINYRLAAEGFLYLGDGAANLGLQDQLAALAWVQDNVAAFGGDPSRVTVAGESAGAMSITTLLSMPRAAGLFDRAITESGAWAHTLTPETGLAVAHTFAGVLGVPAERAALAEVPMEAWIRAGSDLVTEVQTAPDPAKWGGLALSLLPWAPTVDGDVLPQHPLSAFAGGAGGNVPLLTGSNREEARLFVVAPGVIDLVDEPTLLGAAGAYGLDAAGVEVYRRNRPGASPGDLMAAVVTDWFFRIPALRTAEARLTAAATAPTWVYRFDHPEPDANDRLGAAHAVEVPYVFGTTWQAENAPLIGASPSAAVAATTHGIWVRFVHGDDPGWAPYDLTTRVTGLIGEHPEASADPAGDERQVWEGIR